MSSGTSGTPGSWFLASKIPPSTTLSLSALFYLTLAFSTSILAQDVVLRPSAASDSFPACGLTCSLLSQADDSCTPPTAQVTNRQIYVSCFCQSALLATFRESPVGICDDTCTTDPDRQLLQQWYVNFCDHGGNTEDTGANSGNNNNNDNNDNNNSHNDNNGDGTNADSAADATPSPGAGSRDDPAPQSWWSGHYKWVIMVIVLVLGFTTLAILGVWLKRRHDAKHPNLYHAAAAGAGDSRVFANRNHDSPVPGPVPRAMATRRHESMNTVSIASSSRTDVIPKPRQALAPSRLQKLP
ncbi:uncharacterized protein BJX67DRAFT_36965 [Aspergillus lucknowensis]|uniref:Integral membrane protein n=1 Tax=Aspergillus lucknowensis TaxID=176173 RepID=A0ABR4LW59_9EURO